MAATRARKKKVVTKKVPSKTAAAGRKSASKGKAKPKKKVSRTRKPDDLSLDAWQIELRKQYGREQNFELTNVGDAPILSEFQVYNPDSGNSYRVAIRGQSPGENYCSCPDFTTNSLGTCKHIEFALAKLERKRGGKKAFREGFHPDYSEIYLRYGSRRRVCFRPGQECPQEVARLAAKFFDDDGRLRGDAFGRIEKFLAQANDFDHDLRCYDDVLDFIAEVRDADGRRRRVDEAFPDGAHSLVFKDLLKAQLYPYQREGALFAARAGRCLIGDEMGLGKTIQAIAAAEIMARQLGVERVLIVCPTSLKHQWEREIEKFTDRTAQVIGGLQPERVRLFQSGAFFAITNYDTVHRDLRLIEGLAPELVILDEAQRIKNWDTRTAKAVKKIVSPYCMVLTGTPLENRLEELVSIVEFVDRHRLGPTYRFLDEHQVRDEETGRVVGYRNLDSVSRTLQPILVRRTKKEVLDQLPERIDKNFFVPMTPEQWEYHEENRGTVAKVVQKWRRLGFLPESDQRRLMIGLQNMRMSCNSTYLLDRETDQSVKPDEVRQLLGEIFERPDAKAVIFSQWTRTHELIERRFNGEWDHVLFHGGVPSKKRKALVDRFREDARCRVFLSTDAGGVGLNLQHANVVVNMDLPWNPAVLEQRIARVHRLGQEQPVQVVNFVAQGTIEEQMLQVLAFKKSLFAGVLDGGQTEVFLGGSRLQKFMETVENVTGGLDDAVRETAAKPGHQDHTGDPTQSSGDAKGDTPGSPQTQLSPTIAVATDALSNMLQTGLTLLEQLAAASQEQSQSTRRSGGRSTASQSPLGAIERDETTGRNVLKLTLPEPEVLERALQAVSTLLTGR